MIARWFRFLVFCLLSLVLLSGCDSGAERARSDAWEKVREADSTAEYIAFWSVKPADVEALSSSAEAERLKTTKQRLYEIGIRSTWGKCPFARLRLDYKARLQGHRDHTGGEISHAMRDLQIIVEREAEGPSAGDVLYVDVTGSPRKGRYLDGSRRSTGGDVEGKLHFRSRPDLKLRFSGHARVQQAFARLLRKGEKYDDKKHGQGIMYAMRAAGIRAKLAHLVFEICGAEAGFVIYLRDDSGLPHRVDKALEARLLESQARTRAIAVALAVGGKMRFDPPEGARNWPKNIWDFQTPKSLARLICQFDDRKTLIAALENLESWSHKKRAC